MSGTKAGGKKAAKTNKARYGEDFYRVQGAKGGHNGHTGGFAANRELAKTAGAKGGRISRRGPQKIKTKPVTVKDTAPQFEETPQAKTGWVKKVWHKLTKEVI